MELAVSFSLDLQMAIILVETSHAPYEASIFEVLPFPGPDEDVLSDMHLFIGLPIVRAMYDESFFYRSSSGGPRLLHELRLLFQL